MRISIIIPVYNAEETLERCLNSVILQKDVSTEIICINDGSKDNSLKILKEYETKYDNIVVINQDNKGVSEARNAGLEIAKGDYIMFVDADDYLLENSLSTIDLSENLDLYKFGFAFLDNKVYSETKYEDKKICLNDNNFGEVFANILNNVDENMVWGQLFKRELLDNVRFNKKYFFGEDILFNAYVLTNVKTIRYISSIIYYYERRDNSVTKNLSYESIKNKILNLTYMFSEMQEKIGKYEKQIQIKSMIEIVPQIIMIHNKNIDFIYDNKFMCEAFKNVSVKDIPVRRYRIPFLLLKNKRKIIFKIYSKFYILAKKIKNRS
ncbi:MAG: glycosyltransferase [Clostridia bacterium]|nr:glycosyltransferase [Clostridia bacterium]